LVLHAKLVSPSTTFSNMNLTKDNNWDISNNSWTITGSANYNSNITPTALDVIGLMLTVEDGSYIISEEVKT